MEFTTTYILHKLNNGTTTYTLHNHNQVTNPELMSQNVKADVSTYEETEFEMKGLVGYNIYIEAR